MSSKPRFVGEKVRLGDVVSASSERNKGGRCSAVYSVTNSQGFVPSEDYFSKEVYSKDLKTYRVVKRNMIAYNPSRINVGSVALQDKCDEVVVSPLYVVFSVDESRVKPGYAVRFLKSKPGLDQIAFQSIGTVRNNLKFKALCQMRLKLPSLAVQEERLANLASIESQINQSRKAIEEFDQLAKSRFVEMFGDPVINPKRWPVSTIKKTAVVYGDGPFGSNLKSSDYVEDGVRVIRLGNILQGSFSEKDRSFVSYEKYEKLKKYECAPGEVVIATLGDPVLRACIVPDFGVPSIHKADCMYYETDKKKVLPVFAAYAINQPTMLQRAIEDVHGQTRGRINSTQTGSLPMIMPPISLQNEFVQFASQIDKSRFIAQQQIEKLQMLYDSLAQDYFGD